MDIFLIRHCQSVGNSRGTIQGWHDSPLTDEGREQARRLGERLSGRRIELLYSSPLARALETARIVSKAIGTEVVVLDLLKEIDVGAAEGLTVDEVELMYPQQVSHLRGKRDGSASFPDGETLDEFHGRSEKLWQFLTAGDRPDIFAVVSHGWMINALLKRAAGLSLRSRNRVLPNGAVQHLRYRNSEWDIVNVEYSEKETSAMRVWQLF